MCLIRKLFNIIENKNCFINCIINYTICYNMRFDNLNKCVNFVFCFNFVFVYGN